MPTQLHWRQILDNTIALIKLIASGTRDSTTFLRGDGVFAVPPGGWGSFSLIEAEIDFGSGVPVRSKRFTITNASISPASKILVSPSWNVATGRVGNDWEWDDISFIAKAWTWNFVVTAIASGRVKGKRKLFYSFS